MTVRVIVPPSIRSQEGSSPSSSPFETAYPSHSRAGGSSVTKRKMEDI